jgi:hypothetical protein
MPMAPAGVQDIGPSRHQPFVPQCRALGLTLAADQVYARALITTFDLLPLRRPVPGRAHAGGQAPGRRGRAAEPVGAPADALPVTGR